MTSEADKGKNTGPREDEEEYECREMVRVGEREGEENTETEESVILFLERPQEEDENQRNEKIPHDVSDDASGDELGLRGSERVERSGEEEKGKGCEFRSDQLSERRRIDDSVRENGQCEKTEKIDDEQEDYRESGEKVDTRKQGECGERKVFTDDEVGDRRRIGESDIFRLIDDLPFLIDGKTVCFGNGFGPVEVMSEIGRGRDDGV